MDLALKMLKGVSIPRVKDKQGNNIKQHFGIWKYFIDTKTMERQKFYISMKCQRFDGAQGVKVSNQEQNNYISENTVRKEIQSINRKYESTQLEYWGLPEGICEQFYKHTKI